MVKGAQLGAVLAFLLGLLALAGIVITLTVPRSVSQSPTLQPTEELTVYGGEVLDRYGFGLSAEVITSPGPELKVKAGEVVRLIFKNVGKLPHGLKIVEEPRWDAEALFGVVIGDASRPIAPGQEGVVTFRPDRPGTYYYVCPIPGHIEFGMMGRIVVEAAGEGMAG